MPNLSIVAHTAAQGLALFLQVQGSDSNTNLWVGFMLHSWLAKNEPTLLKQIEAAEAEAENIYREIEEIDPKEDLFVETGQMFVKIVRAMHVHRV